jgi:integrase
MKIKLRYVDVIRSNGRTYFFFRHKGKRTPLPGAPGGREFQARYEELLDELTPHVKANLRRAAGGEYGTLGWAIVKYMGPDNPAWSKTSAGTQRVYRRYFEWLRKEYGEFILASFDKKAMKKIRNRLMARPSYANEMIDRLGQIWRWSEEFLGLEGKYELAVDPTKGVRPLDHTPVARKAWPEELCAKFEAIEDRAWAMAYMLLRYTGQREGDVAKMLWSDFNEARGEICVVQQKTGKKIWVPCHKRLRTLLVAAPRVTPTILHSKRTKRQLAPGSITRIIKLRVEEFGFTGYTPHGLRHLAGCELAEAGCNERQIMAILGHTNPRQAQHYMAQAKERRLAKGAMAAWERYGDEVQEGAWADNVTPLRPVASAD